MSPEQGCLASAQKKVKSSVRTSTEIKLALEGPEVIKEPPQVVEETMVGDRTQGLKAFLKPPPNDFSSAWKMFVNGAKTA